MSDDNLLSFCKTLPKVELHAHLNGSISSRTMHQLLKRKHFPKTWETTIAKGQKRSMEECFQMFKIIHEIVDDEDAVSMVAHDVVKEFAEDGVVYLELRSTPRARNETGMTKESYIDAVIRGIESALKDMLVPIYVRLLLSIDRQQSVDEGMDTVMLAEKYARMSSGSDDHCVKVLGVDLSGNPHVGDMNALLPVLRVAKEKGLRLALHLSEIESRNEETLLLMRGAPPDRIGHGTFMHPVVGGTEEIVQEVTRRKIPIEMCLTSNLKTQTVSSLDKHHFDLWRRRNHPVVLCTDDKGVFSTSLSEEFQLAASGFGLTKKEVWALSREAVNYTFEDDTVKNELRALWTNHTQ